MADTWLTKWNIFGGLAVALTAFEVARRQLARRKHAEARDRAAVYLDRISMMLEQMADDLDAKGASPARCAELLEGIKNIHQVLQNTGAGVGVRNALVQALSIVDEAPGFVERNEEEASAERLVWRVERFLDVGSSTPTAASRAADRLLATAQIRKAAGLFKGAAEAMKAL